MTGHAETTGPGGQATWATGDEPAQFDEWCVVELLGHRRLAGRVREVQIAGAGMLRLDIPATPGHGEQTQFVAPGSVYALHPVNEQVARAVAARYRPEPVHRWELPATLAPGSIDADADPDREDDPDSDDYDCPGPF